MKDHKHVNFGRMEFKEADPADKNKAPGNAEEIKAAVEGLGKAWEDFKQKNDERLAEIEKKGNADPLHADQLKKMSDFMDETKQKLEGLQTAVSRPGAGAEAKSEERENAEYKGAFLSYARKGDTSALEKLEGKSLSVGTDKDGGYLVTPQMSAQINKKVFESTPMRQLASIETISSDSLDLIDDVDEVSASWTGETTTRSETDTPEIGKRNIVAHEMYAEPRVTQKLLDDANVNVEAWLADKIAEYFSRLEATAFVSGTGTGKPRGFLTYAAGTSWGQIEQVASGTSADFGADDLIALFYALKDQYAKNSSWLMQRATVKNVRQMKGSDGQYLWQPALTAGAPDMLLGRPLYYANDMEAIGASSLSVAVGDFKAGYKIVDRIGIRTLRDPYTAKPFIKFYTTKRVGGDVTNFEAIKLLKLATS